jgi:hypothetical protein
MVPGQFKALRLRLLRCRYSGWRIYSSSYTHVVSQYLDCHVHAVPSRVYNQVGDLFGGLDPFFVHRSNRFVILSQYLLGGTTSLFTVASNSPLQTNVRIGILNKNWNNLDGLRIVW